MNYHVRKKKIIGCTIDWNEGKNVTVVKKTSGSSKGKGKGKHTPLPHLVYLKNSLIQNLFYPLCCVLLLGFAAVSFAAGPMGSGGGHKHKVRCSTCGMSVAMFADWNAKIEFKDSTHAVFDGAKCMFKYYLDVKKYDPSKSRDDISAIFVKDYYSKEDIDARQAFYVVWSDVYGPMGHEPIPFRNETDRKKVHERTPGQTDPEVRRDHHSPDHIP